MPTINKEHGEFIREMSDIYKLEFPDSTNTQMKEDVGKEFNRRFGFRLSHATFYEFMDPKHRKRTVRSNGKSTLTKEEVQLIRLAGNNNIDNEVLARYYACAVTTIRAVINRKTYQNVPPIREWAFKRNVRNDWEKDKRTEAIARKYKIPAEKIERVSCNS